MRELLSSAWRGNKGWGSPNGELIKDKKLFIQYRPEEDYIDELYHELEIYWDSLLQALPELNNPPATMRAHNVDIDKQIEVTDNLFFWPIGQELLARVVRFVLNSKLSSDSEKLDKAKVFESLKVLNKVNWKLHAPPWRYFMLVYDESKKTWKMRNEERNKVVEISFQILVWILGIISNFRLRTCMQIKIPMRP